MNHSHKLRLSLYVLFTFIAVLIISDFILMGETITDDIINIKRERQQYFNAAKNHHYSYKVTTNRHSFSVEDHFVKLERGNQKIVYSVSRVFKEINWYKLASASKKSFYSLRVVSGLIVPLFSLVAIFITYKFKKNIDILIFVLQVLLIGDLIFLLQ